MLWVLYSLISAFSSATSDSFAKKISNVDDYIINLSRYLFSAILILPLLFFIEIPTLDNSFWLNLSMVIPLEVIAAILYIKAIRHSPLSLVMPFLSLTPAFLIFTSFIMLGELPTTIGFFGILLIVSGAYILSSSNISKGYLEPFKFILREKGVIYMITTAFLLSIVGNFGKILVLKSSPLFFSVILSSTLAISFLIITFFTSKDKLIQIKTNFKSFFVIGFFFALMILFNMLAFTLAIVPYVISIKRTSSIFGVLYGKFMFKEKNIRERLLGAAVMLVGAGLIILF